MLEREDSVGRGVVRAVEDVALKLEGIIRNIKRDLPSVEPDKLPEYQKALDAIREYKTAISNRMGDLYAVHIMGKKKS